MNHETGLSASAGTALGMMLAAGSIGCLQSAFDLTLQNPAGLWGAVFLFASAYALALQWKRGSLVYGCLLAVTAGYLLRYGQALAETKHLLHHLSLVYDRAYHWGVLPFGEAPSTMDLPLGIWAAGIVLATIRTFVLQKRCYLPVLLASVPLAACVVVTDTVPQERYLFVLLAALILLILPASVRQENRLQSLRLMASAVLPVLFGLGILFYVTPQEDYVNQTAVIQENIRTAAAHFPEIVEGGLEDTAASLRGTPAQIVNLSQLGSRIPFTFPVMDVTAEQSGTLYLRGQDYDRYDGLGWTATEDRPENFFRQEGDACRITIRTRGVKQVRYLPYYPAEETRLTRGSLENTEKSVEYTIPSVFLPENWRKTVYEVPDTDTENLQIYTALPEATKRAATKFLEHTYRPGASNTEKADIVAALVTNCASYSLSPEKMPGEEPDFALWFLQKADTGYCVHFATTATVLLRAAGIPARYVTGYMTETIAGETVTVTEEDAHAWAEYFEPRLDCWIPLEATPAAEMEATAPAATQSTTATVPATEPELPESPSPVIPSTPSGQPESPASPTRSSGFAFLLLPVFGLTLVVQRSVRLKLRRKRQHTGSPNAQALQRFREAERLARLLKETPAEELIELAQKAKYSQHGITPEELQSFDSYHRSCLGRLKEKPLYRQFVYRYFYAAY